MPAPAEASSGSTVPPPPPLSVDNPALALGACKIVEPSSPDSYQLDWDTGEILDVSNNGTYLDVSSWLSPVDGPGSVEGLLSTDINPDLWARDRRGLAV